MVGANQIPGIARRCAWLVFALLLAALVLTSFLRSWSLLDGNPRNGLQAYLDGSAHRPFAYRSLLIDATRSVEHTLPPSARSWLADAVAPQLYALCVEPWRARYDALYPGFGGVVDALWAQPAYRANYALVVVAMLLSLAVAILAVASSAAHLGCSTARTLGLTVYFALMLATSFLNGGYFYDFTEQLFACWLVYCAVTRRWGLFAVLLLLPMQMNKETALLMIFFVAPLIGSWRDRALLVKGGFLLALCVAILVTLWTVHAGAPGGVAEWHLPANVAFWRDPQSWLTASDMLASGVPLPRMTYLLLPVFGVIMALRTGVTPLFRTVLVAVAVLGPLMLLLGYRDEFRALNLALPLLVSAIAATGRDLASTGPSASVAPPLRQSVCFGAVRD